VSLLGGGELLLAGEIRLRPGGSYTGPWLYGSYGVGLDELAGRFHGWLRRRPLPPRPVVVNTWEAVYFNHDLPWWEKGVRLTGRVLVEARHAP
jgi:alpha-galactosidase